MLARRWTYLALTAWLVLATLFVFCGRGSFGQGILLVMATLAAFGCWAVGGLLLLIAGRTRSRWREAGRTALVIGTVLFGSWASLPFGIMLNHRDIAEAKAFCEGLIPAIERFKTATGRYPESPPGLDKHIVWPRLIDKGYFYQADANGYGFDFIDPSGMLNGFEYSSSTGEWLEWD